MARVLLVEDEISLLLLAESVVQGLGHSTFSASNRGQALALLDDPDEIDLLFTDVRLPESDLGGFEVAQQARMRKPKLKVLYTTGYTIIEGMKGMYVDGGTMLLKPYTAPELARAVKHLLSQREDARRNTPRKGAPVRSSRGHFQGSRSRRTSVAEVAASRDE